MASLGTVTYAAVIWTAGDIITEAKLDNMVANDQAYDSHKSQGLLLANQKALVGTVTGGSLYDLIVVNGSNIVEIGSASFDGLQFNKAITKPTLNGSVQALTTDVDGGTITFNMTASNLHTVTLGGNRILAVSNASVGQPFIVRLVQDGTGSRTVTWWSTIKWVDGATPILTATANKTDVFGFLCTSAGNYDGYIIGQNL
jgi:hypothetical protein